MPEPRPAKSDTAVFPDGACIDNNYLSSAVCAVGVKGCRREHVVCRCGALDCDKREEHSRVERAAISLYGLMPSEPNHFRSGVGWHELSEADRRTYRARAMVVLEAADG